MWPQVSLLYFKSPDAFINVMAKAVSFLGHSKMKSLEQNIPSVIAQHIYPISPKVILFPLHALACIPSLYCSLMNSYSPYQIPSQCYLCCKVFAIYLRSSYIFSTYPWLLTTICVSPPPEWIPRKQTVLLFFFYCTHLVWLHNTQKSWIGGVHAHMSKKAPHFNLHSGILTDPIIRSDAQLPISCINWIQLIQRW